VADLVGSPPQSEVRGDASVRVVEIGYRSQDALPGSPFFCMPGSRRGGHGFAASAVERETVALL
jgi:UDP-N-acetylmuramyl pentapeptide synthase